MISRQRVFSFIILFAFVSLMLHCGGGSNSGGGGAVAMTVKLLLQDGTEKDLTDTPLPRFLAIRLTFTSKVNTSDVESAFSLKAGNEEVPKTFSWNSENTVATIRPNNLLEYARSYIVSVNFEAAGNISLSEKANTISYSGSFTTMVQGDVNGDGKADLVINAIQWNGGNGTGRTYLFYADNLAAGMLAQNSDAKIDGETAGDALRSFGMDDFNYDGYADINALSYAYGNWKGRNYLFYGGPGDAPISGALSASQATNIFTGALDSSNFRLHASDDVNGDGYIDMIGSDALCNNYAGCIDVFLGPDFGSSLTSADADIVISGQTNNLSLADGGVWTADINNDGIADIIAGASKAEGNNGQLYVFYGGPGLASKDSSAADVAITGEGGSFPSSIVIADINGDARKDIIARALSHDSSKGKLYVYYNENIATNAVADVYFTGTAAGDEFSASTYVGDVNGDGQTDIIADAYYYNTTAGRIYVFYNNSGFTSGDATVNSDVRFTGELNDNLMLRNVVDVNGDGVADIITNREATGGNKGVIYVFYGGTGLTGGVVPFPANVVITGDVVGDYFTYNNCLDVNGDGTCDLIAGSYFSNGAKGIAYIFHFLGGVNVNETASQADVMIDGENAFDEFGL